MQKQDELDQVNAENVPLPTDQHPWAYPMKRPATLRKRSSSKVKSVKKKTRLVHYASYEAMNLVGHIYSKKQHPRVLRRWGLPSRHAHVNWEDLFFDLVYVGVAYKLGVMLNYSIKEGYAWTGALYTMIIFLNVFSSWRGFMEYNARFAANDAYHKVYNLVVIVFGTACTCSHIPYGSVSEFWKSNYHYELGLVVGLMLDRILSWARWKEIFECRKEIWKGWWSNPSSDKSTFVSTWNGEGLTPFFVQMDAKSTRWKPAVITERVETDMAQKSLPGVPPNTLIYSAEHLTDSAKVVGLHHRTIMQRISQNNDEFEKVVKTQSIRRVIDVTGDEAALMNPACFSVDNLKSKNPHLAAHRGKIFLMDEHDNGFDKDNNPTKLKEGDIVMVAVWPAHELGRNAFNFFCGYYSVPIFLYFVSAIVLLVAMFKYPDEELRRERNRQLNERFLASTYASYASYSYGSDDYDDFVHPFKLKNFYIHLTFVLALLLAHVWDATYVLFRLWVRPTFSKLFKEYLASHSRLPPIHLDYAIERYGEWIMYMLGSSVLSLVLVENPGHKDSNIFYPVFFAGFVLAELVLNMHYLPEVFDSEGHAMSRSLEEGYSWWISTKYFSMCLVMLGAATRSVLIYAVDDYYGHSEPEKNVKTALTQLVCISALAVYILQWQLFQSGRGGMIKYFISAWTHPAKDWTSCLLIMIRICALFGTILPTIVGNFSLFALSWTVTAMAAVQLLCMKVDVFLQDRALEITEEALSNVAERPVNLRDESSRKAWIEAAEEVKLHALGLGLTSDTSEQLQALNQKEKSIHRVGSILLQL